MSKPETLYMQKLHKHLPEFLYKEKMNNPYRGGTPDVYYEGNADILWVEYKYLPSLPPTFTLTNPKGATSVTSLQAKWLRRSFENGRNTLVILGIANEGGIIFGVPELDTTYTREELQARIWPNSMIARIIAQTVMLNPQQGA